MESSVRCARCSKVCSGETLRYNDQLFHANCLSCVVCGKYLAELGFFVQDDSYFCPEDFQERFGTKCSVCQDFVEGEGITIGGNTYHEGCFVCTDCRKPFPPGEKVVFNGKDYICQQCANKPPSDVQGHTLEKCAGCGEDIRSGQALLALEKQWHLWCFTCTRCGCLLAGEYMGRDGKPYCEKDYQAEFGVTCAGCGGYITGKVLQAGEKHYHPQCSRCARCHGVFGEGQEMYLQGSEIWHPDCSIAAAQNGELEQSPPGERHSFKDGPPQLDDEAHRPPPPTRTSASRTTDWKVKYSPQRDGEGSYRNDSRGGEDQPSHQTSYFSYKESEPNSYGGGAYRETTQRQQERPIEVRRAVDSRSPLDLLALDREDEDKDLIFPYNELVTTNYKLPRGVDKTKLETYLTDQDFHKVFQMTRDEFYEMPPWKQQSSKKQSLLF